MESGGVERGTIEITDAIRKAGWKPLVASAGGQLLPHINHAGGEHIKLPLDRKNPFIIRANAWRLFRLIKSRGISLVHARSRAPAWSAYYACQWAGIPFVTTFHGAYGLENAVKKRYNSVMVKGDRVIAVSEFIRDHIIKNYEIDPTKLRTIHRGVDFNVFSDTKIIPGRIEELTRIWGLNENFAPVILCPGRISRIKGQHLLIEALAKLPDLSYQCIIAGTDSGHEDYREELEEMIRARGLVGKVRIATPTQYMAEAYTLSAIVVVPSIQPESFGRVAIEAQAMGRIVVATDQGGARETIIPNETGYLVPTDQPEMMAEAIRFCLNREPRVVEAMGAFAKRHVRANFASDKMKSETIAVYRELLG